MGALPVELLLGQLGCVGAAGFLGAAVSFTLLTLV